MSVAFRRDGDEEHLEPKFELPLPPGPNLVTPTGAAQIAAKLAELEAQTAQVTEEEALKAHRRHLRYWGNRHSTAQIIDAPDGQSVTIGTTVTYRLNGQTRQITITGHDEADPTAGKLSFAAPLCRAMMDAEVGELLDFAGKPEAIEILNIKA